MTEQAPNFFMPDGEGGALPPELRDSTYAEVREQAALGFWANFTNRRIFEVVSRHNGRVYTNRVGDLTEDRKFVLGIFESIDERGQARYTVQSLYSTVHVDAANVESVQVFSDFTAA